MDSVYKSPEEVIHEHFGSSVSISGERGVGGGCINDTGILNLSDGSRAFIKRNGRNQENLFLREAEGLRALAAVEGAPAVPQVLGAGKDSRFAFLVMEYLEPSPRRQDFWEIFGREMAALHRNGRSGECGFFHDNHIGATAQPNGSQSSWIAFFREKRLEFQLKLARERGLADSSMTRLVSRVMDRLDTLLIEPDDHRPSLLHGDLWGGNFIDGPEGKACIIDPAAYYGHREADLAMTSLFGGFSSAFYSAYDEAWPLESGFSERRDLYNLYHMLNHLNLFGGGYAGSVLSIASRYA